VEIYDDDIEATQKELKSIGCTGATIIGIVLSLVVLLLFLVIEL
jgi:hypothetical protein